MDEGRVEQFINEVLPGNRKSMLVHEYVPNGTLFLHIHNSRGLTWVLLENCHRICCCTCISSLGSIYASYPQRCQVCKHIVRQKLHYKFFGFRISDYGPSRPVPNQTQVTSTLVRGTLGHLDPVIQRTFTL